MKYGRMEKYRDEDVTVNVIYRKKIETDSCTK